MLGTFVFLMTGLNLALVLAIHFFEKIDGINLVDPISVDKVLIYFNVISFVSMIGVTLTLIFTIIFFRKIRADFENKK